jgi:hypothetical protein
MGSSSTAHRKSTIQERCMYTRHHVELLGPERLTAQRLQRARHAQLIHIVYSVTFLYYYEEC